MKYRIGLIINTLEWGFGIQESLHSAQIARLNGHLEGRYACVQIWRIDVAEMDSNKFNIQKPGVLYNTFTIQTSSKMDKINILNFFIDSFLSFPISGKSIRYWQILHWLW